MTVEIHQSVLDALFTDTLAVELKHIADSQIVPAAQTKAPRLTGEGAASIHAEAHTDIGSRTPVVRIGWDSDHFYMLFAEKGTQRESARPFLRPALDTVR